LHNRRDPYGAGHPRGSDPEVKDTKRRRATDFLPRSGLVQPPLSGQFSSPWDDPNMTEVTQILSAIDQGNPLAVEQLLPLVPDEPGRLAAHKVAQEKPGQTLQATALVHEAYLRLVDVKKAQKWNSRGHFFAAAAEAMRRILIDE